MKNPLTIQNISIFNSQKTEIKTKDGKTTKEETVAEKKVRQLHGLLSEISDVVIDINYLIVVFVVLNSMSIRLTPPRRQSGN